MTSEVPQQLTSWKEVATYANDWRDAGAGDLIDAGHGGRCFRAERDPLRRSSTADDAAQVAECAWCIYTPELVTPWELGGVPYTILTEISMRFRWYKKK